MNLQTFREQLGEMIQNSPSITYQLVATGLIIILLWVIRIITKRLLERNVDDAAVQYKWRKNLGYFFTLIGILAIGSVWSEAFKSLSTFLGLLSAGIAIALRDPVSDIAGWLFILWRRPFSIGDRIQLGDIKGDVIDQRIFKFTLLEIGNWVGADQSTGRVIHMSNHTVFSQNIANYTSDFSFVWNEIPVLVTFESDWRKAKKILQEIADRHLEDSVANAEKEVQRASKSYLIHFRYLTPIVYTEVKDSGINLTIRHLANPRRRRGLGQQIWEDVLDAFNEADDIDFAYPTMRIYKNNIEGKSGTQAPN